jgi:hypothetical protein
LTILRQKDSLVVPRVSVLGDAAVQRSWWIQVQLGEQFTRVVGRQTRRFRAAAIQFGMQASMISSWRTSYRSGRVSAAAIQLGMPVSMLSTWRISYRCGWEAEQESQSCSDPISHTSLDAELLEDNRQGWEGKQKSQLQRSSLACKPRC